MIDFWMYLGDQDTNEIRKEDLIDWENIKFRQIETYNYYSDLKNNNHALVSCKIEPFGYSVKGKIHKIGDQDENIFSFEDSRFFSSCGDFIAFLNHEKQVIIYDAITLERKYGPYDIVTFDEEIPLNYTNKIGISSKWKYLFAQSYNGIWIFDARTGEPDQVLKNEHGPCYDIFIGEDTVLGSESVDGEPGMIQIMAYNVSTKETKLLAKLNQEYKYLEFSPDASTVLIEQDDSIYCIDLTNDYPNMEKIFDSYDFIRAKTINEYGVSIIYVQEDLPYWLLYKNGDIIFKKKLDMHINDCPTAWSSTKLDQIIYTDQKGNIHLNSKNGSMKLNFDYKIHFHDPYIFYVYEKNEIWVQSIHESSKINRYIFINSISATSIVDEVYDHRLASINNQHGSIDLLLTYEKWHRISTFMLNSLNNGACIMRMKEPIHFKNLPNLHMLSFLKWI